MKQRNIITCSLTQPCHTRNPVCTHINLTQLLQLHTHTHEALNSVKLMRDLRCHHTTEIIIQKNAVLQHGQNFKIQTAVNYSKYFIQIPAYEHDCMTLRFNSWHRKR